MKIQMQLEWEDYVKAQLLHLRRPRWLRIIMIAIYGLMGLSFLSVTYSTIIGETDPMLMILGFVFVPIYFGSRYYFMPKKIKRLFFQKKELQVPFEIDITDKNFIFTNEFGHSNRPWVEFVKWKENDELFLIYQSDLVSIILPKRFMEQDFVDTLKKRLIENGVGEKKSPNDRSRIFYYLLIVFIIILIITNFIRSGSS